MDHGHSDARFYPIGMVWSEAELVKERINREDASRTLLMQMAIGSVISKEGGKLLKTTIQELISGE